VALLEQGRRALAPGGLLVYSTCSLEPEENEEVVASVPGALVLETMRRIPGREPGDGFLAVVSRADCSQPRPARTWPPNRLCSLAGRTRSVRNSNA
jgi:16S rRNA C967 or C1407 C5-methylase (RsmB/RsmF family)